MPCVEWVDLYVWQSGATGEEISESVFRMVGDRLPTVPKMDDDDRLVTRGIFLTTTRDVRYEDMIWPGGVPPLVFYSVRSVQQVNHVHVAMVFSYFSKTPGDLCVALGLGGASCTRIKVSWNKVFTYMALQERERLSYVVNRREALEFFDYHRMSTRGEAVSMEDRTLGSPFVLDNHTPRTREWRWQGMQGVTCRLADIQHVALSEMYLSTVTGSVGVDYRGESVVFVPVTERSNMRLPSRAAFVLPYRSEQSTT
jgi:hypothetical protein